MHTQTHINNIQTKHMTHTDLFKCGLFGEYIRLQLVYLPHQFVDLIFLLLFQCLLKLDFFLPQLEINEQNNIPKNLYREITPTNQYLPF